MRSPLHSSKLLERDHLQPFANARIAHEGRLARLRDSLILGPNRMIQLRGDTPQSQKGLCLHVELQKRSVPFVWIKPHKHDPVPLVHNEALIGQ